MKKTIEIIKGETPEAPETPSKAEFKEMLERYKIQNPAKYEAKKAELEKKLAAL